MTVRPVESARRALGIVGRVLLVGLVVLVAVEAIWMLRIFLAVLWVTFTA